MAGFLDVVDGVEEDSAALAGVRVVSTEVTGTRRPAPTVTISPTHTHTSSLTDPTPLKLNVENSVARSHVSVQNANQS